jgi:hypothetical protein
MSRPGPPRPLMAALMAAAGALGMLVAAGVPEVPWPTRGAGPPPPPVSPPQPPAAVTPVDRFRDVLGMPPAERDRFLAGRSPEQREYLRARLAEFDALGATDRELRLQLLALRHHLLPVLRAGATNRTEELRRVPAAYRELVLDRLAAWDLLPADQQRELLASESVFTGLPLLDAAGGAARRTDLSGLPPSQQLRLQAELDRWESIPEADRARITRRFQAFLTLTERERGRTLARLDATDRERAGRLLQAFGELAPDQRSRSFAALQRLSALSPQERDWFLVNAARWQAMAPEERAAWRRLKAKLPPPPPGIFQGSPPVLPPAPPARPGPADAPVPP